MIYGLTEAQVIDLRHEMAILERNRDPISPAERAVRVRNVLESAQEPITTADIAEAANVPKGLVSVELDKIRAELKLEYRRAPEGGGRVGYWRLKRNGQ